MHHRCHLWGPPRHRYFLLLLCVDTKAQNKAFLRYFLCSDDNLYYPTAKKSYKTQIKRKFKVFLCMVCFTYARICVYALHICINMLLTYNALIFKRFDIRKRFVVKNALMLQ